MSMSPSEVDIENDPAPTRVSRAPNPAPVATWWLAANWLTVTFTPDAGGVPVIETLSASSFPLLTLTKLLKSLTERRASVLVRSSETLLVIEVQAASFWSYS